MTTRESTFRATEDNGQQKDSSEVTQIGVSGQENLDNMKQRMVKTVSAQRNSARLSMESKALKDVTILCNKVTTAARSGVSHGEDGMDDVGLNQRITAQSSKIVTFTCPDQSTGIWSAFLAAETNIPKVIARTLGRAICVPTTTIIAGRLVAVTMTTGVSERTRE